MQSEHLTDFDEFSSSVRGMGHSSAGLSPSAQCLLTQSPFVSEFS